MVSPLVDESLWLETLRGVPRWSPPAKSTVIIAPHPDDETLGAGGLIALQRRLNIPVSVVAVTDGEAAYPGVPGLAELRRKEQNQALKTLGVASQDIARLGLPDSAVTRHESDLAELLSPHFTPDSLVIAPWSLDSHPDHEATGRAAKLAAHAAGSELVFYLFWTWHQKPIESLASVSLQRLELDDSLMKLKESALQFHRSQLYSEAGPPILPEQFLAPARRSFETFIANV